MYARILDSEYIYRHVIEMRTMVGYWKTAVLELHADEVTKRRVFHGLVRGVRPPTHAVRREGMAHHVLHEGHGALADERDRHQVGTHAVARDAAGGVKEQQPMTTGARRHD